ncbi:GNAT family N-acetyltransferase [Nocardioides bizhenqiangii]|uniref:GNAT family N-acetyltransferase n=1 Tax=Nocardioides bizhenqiangii TaxID=3095076 RepID=A0ABZ0ZLY0_9ACTN|nr:GNAT family N-acetyltransferase [Nocardioides sp. HM61]WQQ24766.1 GNAT family N-acetyltransferase [Nocardioides sp. HM61]
MDITRFGPDDVAALKEWVELSDAVRLEDSPWETEVTLLRTEARFRVGWDGEPSTPYLATVDGTVVGGGAINTSEYDNLHLAWLGVLVHPDHRRQGYGSGILAHLEDEVRRMGRTSVGMDGWESDATRGFAAKHGYEKKHQAIARRQYLADIDRAELDRRYDEALAAATDYALERQLLPTPEADLDDLAEMASAINDAPTDDLEIEDEVFNAQRMKAYEDACAFRRERAYRVVARHVPSGKLAGQTVVVVESERPAYGDQHDTSVVRAHRGHRLGLLLKVEMLRWLAEAEPQVEHIETFNAESNDHMIGVNEVLGYRVMARELAFQKSL